MNPTHVLTTNLEPHFHWALSDKTSPSDLLLGQARLVASFNLALQITNQSLFVADYAGMDRAAVFHALCHPQKLDYSYLQGNIRRAALFGKNSNQTGLLSSGGVIFICVDSLLRYENLWHGLLQVLLDEQVHYNDGSVAALNCQLVLIGSSQVYSELTYHEAKFTQVFPLLAECNAELDLNQDNAADYCRLLQVLAARQKLRLQASALAPLLKYASRQCEHQDRLSLNMIALAQLMTQASVLSDTTELDNTAMMTALDQFHWRHNSSEQFSAQNFDDAFIVLETAGEVIGQINGLTVIDSPDFSYGEPARITASVHYGDGEVADIERKSELGGNIHAKGMMILSACLYRVFGRDAPLHLNANIVFEQSYQEIDGDSASLAEYCALMSAIAERPILQGIAVTGALDQMGNVQAIGGVNEKIEGFFNLCVRRQLTGQQGVIIPKANVCQLNLKPEVIQAINDQQFHLYQVDHIDQAVELLMSLPAGVADDDNNFADDTLYGLVQQRLDRMAGHDDAPLTWLEKFKILFSRRGE
ncbi:S16 family serine protease [Shewanella sp. NIFS-20-20]|uniref:S16 family serine protease n=1 Tax=Shewanella sp. NIFS-20-20 TaxID=2853806 RepID=UPI001C483F0F|nr:S16 family serine protease [Shewanella sp. NIFS-20-20]MBV7317491.1 AAA family ATPase [Shewanella sp. NIFS-20-20]